MPFALLPSTAAAVFSSIRPHACVIVCRRPVSFDEDKSDLTMPAWYNKLRSSSDGQIKALGTWSRAKQKCRLKGIVAHWRRNHNESVSKRFKQRFYEMTKEKLEDGPDVVDTTMQAVYNASVSTAPHRVTSTHCSETVEEMMEMLDHFDYFVESPLERISSTANSLVDVATKFQDVEDMTKKNGDALLALQVISRVCSALPVVGLSFNHLSSAMANAKKQIDRLHKALKSFNEKYTCPAKEIVEPFVENIEAFAEKIQIAKFALVVFGVEPTLLVDSACPLLTSKTVCSTSVNNGMREANGVLTATRNGITQVQDAIVNVYNTMKYCEVL